MQRVVLTIGKLTIVENFLPLESGIRYAMALYI